MERMTLARTGGMSRMSQSRATVREIDDKHLMQEIKKADGLFSETFSNEGTSFERFQMVGFTAVPLKQFEDAKQNKPAASTDGFNNNQPKGKSAEAVLLFVNGQRSHPVAFIDDRRVRPYNMKAGDAALYHASGTEQKTYLSDAGAFVIANNNPSEEKDAKTKERFASLRHVTVEKQKRQLKKGDQVPDHKHEGDSVNLEVRCTSGRIEFRAGDTVVGYYEASSKTWCFIGDIVTNQITQRFETVGPTYLGLESKNENPPIGEAFDIPYKQTYVKLS